MPLSDIVVENGCGLPNATTIQTNETITEFANSRIGYDRWSDLDGDFQRKCNITSMDVINQMLWKGCKLKSFQSLAFPRIGLVDESGNCFPSHVIPDAIFFAHARITLAMALGLFVPPGLKVKAKIKSLSAEGVSMSFDNGVQLGKDGCDQFVTTNPLLVMGDEARLFLKPRLNSLVMRRA